MQKRTPSPQRQNDAKARLGFVLSLVVLGTSLYTGWPAPGHHWRLVQALTLAAGALGLVITGIKLARAGRRAMHTRGNEETADAASSAPPPGGGIGSR